MNTSARRVLAHLRRGPMTVEDLAMAMHITSNAVRNQLTKLRESNFVVLSGTRPGPSKPSAVYSITLEGQAQFSTIYLPLLTQFLRVAEARCPDDQLASFMTQTGKELGAHYRKPVGDVKARANAGGRILKSFGGIPEVRAQNGNVVIRSRGCPLSALTMENPAACHVLEGLLSEYLAAPAKICCTYDPEPQCCFEVER